MKVSGEAYTKRLQTFADSTIKLILETKTKENYRQVSDITTETDYTEQQVVGKLQAIKRQKENNL